MNGLRLGHLTTSALPFLVLLSESAFVSAEVASSALLPSRAANSNRKMPAY